MVAIPDRALTLNEIAELGSQVSAGELTAIVGGKAQGLALLHRHGFRVPETWVLPAGSAGPLPAGLGGGRWAVRSSATVEDSALHSFAGMFSSELDVAGADVPDAVARVLRSVGDERVAVYLERAGLAVESVAMAVVLQRFEPPRAAGVWIGRGTAAGRLEWVTGTGEKLVSGTADPHWEEWAGDQVTAAEGPLEHLRRPVGDCALAVQRALGADADLEFAVLDSGLVWLQCRPVTRRPAAAPPARVVSEPGTLTGVCAAPGFAVGPAACLTDPLDPAWSPGSVLVTAYTDPGWVPLMAEASALVTTTGGALCHTAIVARELGVPCVTGVSAALRELRTGMAVEVDGDRGTVRPVESS